MKKRLLTAFGAMCFAAIGFAQTSLPTSWDFSTATLPTGWTSSGSGFAYYSASGNPAPAAKFAATGDKLTIAFSNTPGNLTYDLTGNSFSGGTFLVEESPDGSTWTTLHSHTAPPAGTYTPFTDVPNGASRYIRFNYQNKVTGNVGIDNVAIALGFATTQQINVQQSAVSYINGSTYAMSSPVSTMTPTTFTVQNLGTASTLNITSATITGSAAADYSVASFPSTVAASSSGNLVVNFTPSAAGTRNATLTIVNDDPTNGTYIIYLYGVGGTLATEPTAQGTALNFTGVKSYRYSGSFTAASPAPDGGYLILRKAGSAITDVPVDGTVYQKGDVIGASKVVSSSSAMTIYPTCDVIAGTQYFYAVFAYNGPGVYRNYLTTSPLSNSVTTSTSMMPPTYYSSISTAAPTFVTDLHNKVNAHSIQYYSNFGPLMVSKFYSRDTTAGQKVATCVYSGENKVYTEPWDWTTNNFSREHTYCHSWMPTVNDPGTANLPEYNDYHMLTPTNQNEVNAMRSNYPLGEVVGTPTYTYLGCKVGFDANGHKVFEPRDSDKGDAARAMMYECITYTGVAYSGPANTNCTYGGSWSLPSYINTSIPYGQDQDVLKRWHYQDPPDNLERAHNDYVDSLQGNRNPFIDSVQFVCYIDFSTMTKINSPLVPCSTVGINELEPNSDLIQIAPNPNNGAFVMTYITDKEQKLTVRLMDIMGRIVYSNSFEVHNGYNPMNLNIANLSKGIYSVECVSEKGRKTERIVIE